MRSEDDYYRFWHGSSVCGAQTCVNRGFTGGAINNWRFVSGSSCTSTNTLYICYGNTTGGMNCNTKTDCSGPWTKWTTSGSWSYIGVGSKWISNPDADIKDVRYYYSKWLSNAEMYTIKNAIACCDYCYFCSAPDTCLICNDGFYVSAGICLPC